MPHSRHPPRARLGVRHNLLNVVGLALQRCHLRLDVGTLRLQRLQLPVERVHVFVRLC